MASARVGNVEILSFVDLTRTIPLSQVFPEVPEDAWGPYSIEYPDAIVEGMMTSPVSVFALMTANQTVLVDTGFGPGPFEFLGGARGVLLEDEGS